MKDGIQKLIHDQTLLFQAVEANDLLIAQCEKQILARIESKLRPIAPNVMYSNMIRSGSRSSTWQPGILVFGVYADEAKRRWFLKIKGQWGLYDGTSGLPVDRKKVLPFAPTFDVAKFEVECVELAEELGLPIQILDHGFADESGPA